MCFKRGRKKTHIKKRENKQEDKRGRNPMEKKMRRGGGGGIKLYDDQKGFGDHQIVVTKMDLVNIKLW
jgi:hypothetical protein